MGYLEKLGGRLAGVRPAKIKPKNLGHPAMMRKASVAATLVLFFLTGCGGRYIEVPITSSVEVSTAWTEIRPAQPLHWTEPVEEVDFHLPSPYHGDAQTNVVAANGEKWVPDLQLVGSDGKIYALDAHGFWGDDMFFTRDKLPASVAVDVIRIRSKVPLRISNVRWTGYNPAEVKR